MSMDIITHLETKVEAHHEEALRALQVLKAYLSFDSVAEINGTAPKKISKRRRLTGSNRDRVFAIIAGDWATVDEIANGTGLTIRQVRGVVNAPGVRHRIDTQDVGGRRE